MSIIVNKKIVNDKRHGRILEPFFGRNLVILYKCRNLPKDKDFVTVKMDKDLIPAGTDLRGVPVFIRKCEVIY